MRGMQSLLVLALSLVLACSLGCSRESSETKRDPREAPDFELTSVGGEQVTLSQYRGKVVLLHFWATWCPPCKKAIPDEIELLEEFGRQGFAVIGLSMDKDTDELKEFLSRQELNYPIVQVDEATCEAYGGISTLPVMLLIDRQGRIRKRTMGYTREIASGIERAVKMLLAEDAPLRVAG